MTKRLTRAFLPTFGRRGGTDVEEEEKEMDGGRCTYVTFIYIYIYKKKAGSGRWVQKGKVQSK